MAEPHACYPVDPDRCWDLRYYGYSPAEREDIDIGESCACPCHMEG